MVVHDGTYFDRYEFQAYFDESLMIAVPDAEGLVSERNKLWHSPGDCNVFGGM